MNEVSDPTAIIIVLVVLGLLVADAALQMGFIALRTLGAIARAALRRGARQTKAKEHLGVTRNAPDRTSKEPAHGTETTLPEPPAATPRPPPPPPVADLSLPEAPAARPTRKDESARPGQSSDTAMPRNAAGAARKEPLLRPKSPSPEPPAATPQPPEPPATHPLPPEAAAARPAQKAKIEPQVAWGPTPNDESARPDPSSDTAMPRSASGAARKEPVLPSKAPPPEPRTATPQPPPPPVAHPSLPEAPAARPAHEARIEPRIAWGPTLKDESARPGRSPDSAMPRSASGTARQEPPLRSQTPPPEPPADTSRPPEPPPLVHSSFPETPAARPAREVPTERPVRSGWIPKGESARVAGRDIGGMVYVGPAPTTGVPNQQDNAFIDPSKDVSRRGGDYEGRGISYWPNYSHIDPRSRATYLEWLSGERSDTRYDAGYVFLYFYGLERRVFVDLTDAQERADIVAEVHRLLEVYGDHDSIRRYLSAFVDAASLLDAGDDAPPAFGSSGYGVPTGVLRARFSAQTGSFWRGSGYDVPIGVLQALGGMASGNVPLTSDWLLSWFLCSPETKLRTPASRVFPEFKIYFRHLFDQRHPDGLRIHAPERRLKFQYHAASGNFTADLTEHLADLPDISSLSAPLRIAQEIADTSADGLDKYSRFLGRNPDGRGSIEAHALLPEALWPLFPCPEKEQLQTWATEQIDSGGFVPVEDVAERLEGTRPERIGRRQLIGTADALARLGVGMAPDPRFALRNPRLGEPVVLFHLPHDARTIESPGDAYRSAILNLAVATLVAHADGRIDQAEREHLTGQIGANESISEADRARLRANLSWMIAIPPDIAMMRTRLRDAPEEARHALSRLAVAVATADGTINPEEIRVIERLYAAMGMDRQRVHADLHGLTSAPEPVTVRPAERATHEFTIPPPPREHPPGPVVLDGARISAVMADTARVSQVLGDIFSDEDGDEEERAMDDATDANDEFTGLDAPHRGVASALITRRQWSADKIEDLAEAHRLMAGGAIEAINEWAFDKFGEILIEEEHDGYETNGDIAQQLMR